MEPGVIFEDDNLLVLAKPAGWIVNEAETTGTTPVLQNWLMKNFDYPVSDSREFRSGIVHRLDKETSGILLIAKTETSFNELQRQFKDREVLKTYTALVHGKLSDKEGEIKSTVGRLPWRRDRFGIVPGGRESLTKFKVIDFYVHPSPKNPNLSNYSLVEFYPRTGRTHQIRIHAKYIGHPLVADEFYAGRKTAKADRKWCPRLFLHASGIIFTDPVTKEKMIFKSDLPVDLTKSLKILEKL